MFPERLAWEELSGSRLKECWNPFMVRTPPIRPVSHLSSTSARARRTGTERVLKRDTDPNSIPPKEATAVRRYARLCARMSSHTVDLAASGAAGRGDPDDMLIKGLRSVGSPSVGTGNRLELDEDDVSSTREGRGVRFMLRRSSEPNCHTLSNLTEGRYGLKYYHCHCPRALGTVISQVLSLGGTLPSLTSAAWHCAYSNG